MKTLLLIGCLIAPMFWTASAANLVTQKKETVRVEMTVAHARDILPTLPESIRTIVALAIEALDEDHVMELTYSYTVTDNAATDSEIRPNVRDTNNNERRGHCKLELTIRDKGKTGGSIDIGNRVVGGSGDAHHATDREIVIKVEGDGNVEDCGKTAESLIRSTRP